MVTSNNIFSALLFIICVLAWRALGGVSHYGAFFPKVIIVFLAFLVIVQLIMGIRKPEHTKIFDSDKPIYLFITLIGIILYVWSMTRLGFLLSSMLFMAVFFWFLGEDRTPKTALKTTLIAVAVSTGFYTIFAKAFLVPLPKGIFFF